MNLTDQIDQHIKEQEDWKQSLMTEIRNLVHTTDPEIVEEWKWGTPVFSHNGLVVAIGAFKDKVKINFFKGATLQDSNKLFNAGMESKSMRSIDFYKEDKIDGKNLQLLIQQAVSLNIK